MEAGSVKNRDSERGATLLEFALISPVFLLLLFGIIQLALMGIGLSAADLAVRELQSDLNDAVSIEHVMDLVNGGGDNLEPDAAFFIRHGSIEVSGFPGDASARYEYVAGGWQAVTTVPEPVSCTGYLTLDITYDYHITGFLVGGSAPRTAETIAVATC